MYNLTTNLPMTSCSKCSLKYDIRENYMLMIGSLNAHKLGEEKYGSNKNFNSFINKQNKKI